MAVTSMYRILVDACSGIKSRPQHILILHESQLGRPNTIVCRPSGTAPGKANPAVPTTRSNITIKHAGPKAFENDRASGCEPMSYTITISSYHASHSTIVHLELHLKSCWYQNDAQERHYTAFNWRYSMSLAMQGIICCRRWGRRLLSTALNNKVYQHEDGMQWEVSILHSDEDTRKYCSFRNSMIFIAGEDSDDIVLRDPAD
ncbi:hypothetical protein BKA67DRAFT_535655 [Truncatella angustata]|uniref:Uncharacterized protein n=1 Tax=Truncatella angustata TaxID=152316 RepID=A0A9P8ULE4_9PEZI|nr:uncharacterized protein BKA67DRAFT_535655 [Truncatella angustata]KAH6654328.1 hypothetical protein BKA67DRAFT_535655 [Truncatella angustata]